MKPRSKKYHKRIRLASDDGSKKGSANRGGYNEQNEKNIKKPNEHPAPSVEEDLKYSKS
ncbi:MAG: hypothetical protein ABIR03_07500 [Ginsengibacter sp.]